MTLLLGLDVSQAGPVTVIVVRGELDAASAPDLGALWSLLNRTGDPPANRADRGPSPQDADPAANARPDSAPPTLAATEVALDVGELAFIDSHGVAAILDLRDRFVAAGGDVFLMRPSRLLLRILEATGRQISVLPGTSSRASDPARA